MPALSEYYIPCDDNIPLIKLMWAGFETNTDEIAKAGWLYKVLYNKYKKKYLVRFYHPKIYMTFALQTSSLEFEGKIFMIDFMSIGGHSKRRPCSIKFQELTHDEIPMLLDMAVKLQSPLRRKQISSMDIPSATIIPLPISAKIS